MDAKAQTQRMNEIKMQAAEMILADMEEAAKDRCAETRADKLSKLGASLYGLQIMPEPFDPSTFGKLMMGGIAAPAPDEGGAVQ